MTRLCHAIQSLESDEMFPFRCGRDLIALCLYTCDLRNITHTLFACQVLSVHLVFTAWSTLLLIELLEIWVNVLISRLSLSVGKILIWEFGLIMTSFHKRETHLHNWVSGGALSDWQPVISGLKCLSWGNIQTLFQFFISTLKSQLALDFSVSLSCTFLSLSFFAPFIFFLVHTAQSRPRWPITGPATPISLYNSCSHLHSLAHFSGHSDVQFLVPV